MLRQIVEQYGGDLHSPEESAAASASAPEGVPVPTSTATQATGPSSQEIDEEQIGQAGPESAQPRALTPSA